MLAARLPHRTASDDEMNPRKIVQRFLFPSFVVTLLYGIKYRCFVSVRAEVEYSPHLTIGRKTQISAFTKVKATDGPIRIGANVSIAAGCFISSHVGGVVIGDDCLISPNVSIIDGNYRYDRLDVPIRKQGYKSAGITIGNNVWIGAGCVILDGVAVGDGAILLPNSVVSSSIPANAIAQGSPAKVIFTRR